MNVSLLSGIVFLLAVFPLLQCCAVPSVNKLVISDTELSNGILDQLGTLPHLNDLRYQTVDSEDIFASSYATWLPWRAEVWDCDDQAVALLYDLRLRRLQAGAIYAPTAGRTGCTKDGGRHAVIWFVEHNGRVSLFDPTSQTILSKGDISEIRDTFDK